MEKCIEKLKRNKAAYLDKVTGEHLMYGGSHIVHEIEMSAIHLIKTYCLPTMLYGCEDCGHCRTAVLAVLVLHGTTVLF